MKIRKLEFLLVLILLATAVVTWLPRARGPIDFRSGINMILGKSLAEGKGYRVLSEPGEIRTVQDPPLYPAVVAAHIKLVGNDDPLVVARAMRFTNFLLHALLILGTYLFARVYLSPAYSFLVGLICVLHTSVIYLTELMAAELLFCVLVVSFFLALRLRTKTGSALAFITAALAFYTKTAGVLLLAMWVMDSLRQKRLKPTALRFVIALAPVLLWYGYVAYVVRSAEFQTPAYAYQRDDFQYYNTTYSRYITVRNPMQPEKGKYTQGELVQRSLHYFPQMGKKIGANVAVNYGYIRDFLARQNVPFQWPKNFHYTIAYFFGWIAVAGILILAYRKEWLLFAFLLLYLIPVSIWTFSDDMWRLLIPLAPIHITAFVIALLAVKSFLNARSNRVLKFMGGAAFIVPLILLFGFQLFAVRDLYRFDHREVSIRHGDRTEQFRWFHYDNWHKAFDESIDWLQANGDRDKTVVTVMPYYVYLRTGMQTVRPPNSPHEKEAQKLMDTVPAGYLLAFDETERAVLPNENNRAVLPVHGFPDYWSRIYTVDTEPVSIWERRDKYAMNREERKKQSS